MEKRVGKSGLFYTFLSLNLLACVAVTYWAGQSLRSDVIVLLHQNEPGFGLPGKEANISTLQVLSKQESFEESEAYFEKLFPLSPDEELRKKSDELRNLTPAQYYGKLNQSLQEAQKRKYVIIEMYRKSFGRNATFTKYECGSCQVNYNLDKVDDPKTKAIAFHFVWANKERYYPKKRRSDQYYVWQSKESSAHMQYYNLNLRKLDNVFNMTMMQRRYGDIVNVAYSAARLHDHLQLPMTDQEIDDLISKKDRLALWVVSHCDSPNGLKATTLRMEYAKKLAAYGLDLTFGGACFNNTQKKFDNYRYKFYLAFENSWNCSDYITEKYWRNSIMWGSVPVVLGPKKSDMIETGLPNSFVYAHDFESAEKLAEYLLYLDKNTTAYREYFMWRKLQRNDMPYHRRADRMCQLCRIVNGINIDNLFNTKYEERFKHIPMFGYPKTDRVVPSIEDYLYKDENEGCIDSPPEVTSGYLS